MAYKRFKFLGVAAVVLMVAMACGGSNNPGTSKQYKIGLVTDIGGLNDKSFNHLAYVGLEKAKTDFGIKDDVTESKSGNDYVNNLTGFASKNYDLVIGVGFLMQEAVGTVSGQFPNIHFAIIDGAGTDANGNDLKHTNVESLFFKEQDAGAMVGVIAGWMEKNGKAKKNKHVIGAVGGISIPPVNHYIAGYKWAATMEDPSVIASALKKVDVATYTAIKNVVNGQFQAGALTFSIANDGAGYAVDNLTVPAELQTELKTFQDKIKAGTLTPPADIPTP